MNFQAPPNPELDAILEDLLEDRLNAQDAARLNLLLRTDASARDRYLLYIELHGALLYDQVNVALLDGGPDPAEAELGDTMILPAIVQPAFEPGNEFIVERPAFEGPPIARLPWYFSRPAWISAAALVLITLGSFFYFSSSPPPAGPTLAAVIDASWDFGQPAPQVGRTLPASEVRLTSGLARITFSTGAQIVVEGPARLKADDVNGITLLFGKLTAVVPPAAHGFSVKCPDATVIDLGTQFGVDAGANGGADLDVFEGTVSLAPKTPMIGGAQQAHAEPTLLHGGSARRVSADGSIAPIASNAGAYFRREDFDRLLEAPAEAWLTRWRVYSERLRANPDLVAYYNFERSADAPDRLLNQSSLGSALDGVLGGGDANARPQWSVGRSPGKGALAFQPGSAQHVSLPDSPAIDFAGHGQRSSPFTICAWFLPAPNGPATGAIICRGHGRAEQYAIDFPPIGVLDGNLRTWVRSEGDSLRSAHVLTDPIAGLNAWHMVATVYDPANAALRMFVDGQLVRATPVPLNLLSVGDINIGSRKDLSDHFDSTFTGSIDELAIFKKPLSADEISEMYSAGKPE